MNLGETIYTNSYFHSVRNRETEIFLDEENDSVKDRSLKYQRIVSISFLV